MSHLGTDCKCGICQNPIPEPRGELKAQLSNYGTCPNERDLPPGMCLTSDQVHKGIRSMTDAGFGFSTVPMLALHRMALTGHLVFKELAEALKLALKLYFVIEPAQVPSIQPPLHLFTLHQIFTIIYAAIIAAARHPVRRPLPDNIAILFGQHHIDSHLRYKLVLETVKCFGEDSAIFRREKGRFEKFSRPSQSHHGGVTTAAYVPLSESLSEKIKFIGLMRQLLEWADVQGVPDEDLL
jgi:hypothetical protein